MKNKNINGIDSTSNLKYNIFSNNKSIKDYIDEDHRKMKFKNYSNSLDFFSLDYELMNEISAKSSNYAHKMKIKNMNFDIFDSYVGKNGEVYSIYLDLFDNEIYSVKAVIATKEEVMDDVYVRFKK